MAATRGTCGSRALVTMLTAAAMVSGANGDNRSFDGSGNNVDHPEWGRAETMLLRLSTVGYADGISAPAGPDRPNPRMISNVCGPQPDTRSSRYAISNMHTLWGQFLDHDITLAPEGPTEYLPVVVPAGDPWFDPDGGGDAMLPFMRSIFDPATGGDPKHPRQQVNVITAFVDGSMIYGSSAEVAQLLRQERRLREAPHERGRAAPIQRDGSRHGEPAGRAAGEPVCRGRRPRERELPAHRDAHAVRP